MKSAGKFLALSIVLATLAYRPVDAQTLSDDSAVWSVIEQSWQATRQGNTKWVDELLSADFVGWGVDAPAPRDKSSTRLWTNFDAKQSEVLEYELYPLSIVVHGDMAVAHYLFSVASKDKGEPVEVDEGRYTDVLVRVDGKWRYIAWHGGVSD